MPKKIAIVGGVAAGMSAAAKAHRVNPDLDIHVYTDEEYISYAGCGLPYFIGDRIHSERKLIARTIEQFTEQNIKVHIATRVLDIYPDKKSLLIRDARTSTELETPYDRLVLATGARPVKPALEGINLNGVFTLRKLTDSLSIRQFMLEYKPRRAVVIGGGYIGLEMVENLKDHGCEEVTIIERAPQIIPNMDANMAELIQSYLESKGVKVRTGESVLRFEGKHLLNEVITDQDTIPADFALLSVGVQPNSELADRAGITLGTRNAIRVNSKMETSRADIYAAGDCATTFHRISGQEVYIPMGTTANKQGKIAGENVAGGNASFPGVLGTGIAKIMEMEVSRCGLNERECQSLGIKYTSHTIKSKTAAHYWPGSGSIYVKIIAGEDRRIIGGQIVGYAGAAKRIDILVTAMTMGATVDQLLDMDLAYAPPFSPVWDPVLVALNQF
ncbi:FAD-dependent oxidoreductase [Syntrophomonas erecta]